MCKADRLKKLFTQQIRTPYSTKKVLPVAMHEGSIKFAATEVIFATTVSDYFTRT